MWKSRRTEFFLKPQNQSKKVIMKITAKQASQSVMEETNISPNRLTLVAEETDLMIAISGLERLFKTMRDKGISNSVLHVVSCLYSSDNNMMSTGELAIRMGCSSASITGIVDSVERLDFGRRVANPKDRRSVFVRLTDRGIVFAEWVVSCLATPNRT
jgi:DNA-binding MarR family transcriptional regulator